MGHDDTAAAPDGVILRARGVRKEYRSGAQVLEVLRGVELEVRRGEAVAITGASGVGKSTLLHILGTLDRPTEGTLEISQIDVLSLGEERLAEFRNQHIGFVFQFHNLLPEFTALENVMLPAMIARHEDGREARARELLDRVGLGHRLEHRPGELSGGECQRVAVARALIMAPRLVLADEPSGNLDHEASVRLHGLLRELARVEDQTFMVMTHDRELAASLDRSGRLDDGYLQLD